MPSPGFRKVLLRAGNKIDQAHFLKAAGSKFVRVDGNAENYLGRILDLSSGTGARPMKFAIELHNGEICLDYLPDGTPLPRAIFFDWESFEGDDRELFDRYCVWLETDKLMRAIGWDRAMSATEIEQRDLHLLALAGRKGGKARSTRKTEANRANAKARADAWTAEEEAMFPRLSDAEIAEKTGRSLTAVRAKRRRMRPA